MIPEAAKEQAGKIERAYVAKAQAELRAADLVAPGSDCVPWGGSPIAELALVKGLPGPAEAAGGAALSGPDGDAALKAAERLGYRPDAVFFTLSRSQPSLGRAERGERLRLQLEAVGATTVVALDREAAVDLAEAFTCDELPLGKEVRSLGRRLIAVDGLEASLTDAVRKRVVWAQLQPARRQGPSY